MYADLDQYSLDPTKIAKRIQAKEIKSVTDLSSKDIASIIDYAGRGYFKEIKRRLSNNWRLFLAYIVTTQVHFRQDLQDKQNYCLLLPWHFSIMQKWVGEQEISQGIFCTRRKRDKELGQALPEDGRNG